MRRGARMPSWWRWRLEAHPAKRRLPNSPGRNSRRSRFWFRRRPVRRLARYACWGRLGPRGRWPIGTNRRSGLAPHSRAWGGAPRVRQRKPVSPQSDAMPRPRRKADHGEPPGRARAVHARPALPAHAASSANRCARSTARTVIRISAECEGCRAPMRALPRWGPAGRRTSSFDPLCSRSAALSAAGQWGADVA